jgi:Zn-dependent peptidase ImmA (M78 family)/transcriptional regulator with XRE-family HTH domain
MSTKQHNLPARIAEIRALVKLSQAQLAMKLGVSTSLVCHWEKGTRTPSESQTLGLARHMGVALDYLLNAEIRPHFQPRTRVTSPDQDAIDRTLLDASMQVHYLDTAHRLAGKAPAPFSLCADFDSFDNLANITSHLRDTLKLNRRVSLDELKQALSEWNIYVFDWKMPWHLSGLSYRGAFSVIFINYEHLPARRLFTLAHEFAHVVFHLGREQTETKERMNTAVSLASCREPIEKQANAFAAELLMPRADLEKLVKTLGSRLRDPACLEAVAQHFNVSRDAIFYRLTQLDVFRWTEKSTYFVGKYTPPAPPAHRVEDHKKLDRQVDPRFRDLALSLHQADKISTGKLAEWFFAPRHVMEEYLAELSSAKENAISDGPNHEEELAAAD